ncbi:efflux RND transporter periplasmic adaptor subunit [Pseudooceanicola sp. C21-150M6]|uniref:efflux RND transporter periplasmic adaptor subunit n=1 Tax=Pseudooceanicola sp. C21-150M6 TaxID=3434355 RepID=UPI003D7FEBF4
MNRFLNAAFALLIFAICPTGAVVAQQATGSAGPKAVGVLALGSEDVPFAVTVPGRAVAFEQVDIRPRVAGVIAEILYQPGRPLEVGDPLFRIDGDTYEADLKSANAAVDGAEAAYDAARNVFDRYEKLRGTTITAETLESARVSVAQAEADLSAAEASRDMARLNLDRTLITSPIQGLADFSTVSVGAIVTANQTDALTTVTRIDPIYVDIEQSARRIQETRDMIAEGTVKQGESVGLSLQLETGRTYEREGEFVSPGTTVSTTTGTTSLRLKFSNPERRILPGQFLRVEVTIGSVNAVLVPQRATSRTADGVLTAFVAEGGKAVKRTLTEQGNYQNAWIVRDGVSPGDLLIVDGLTNLRAGADVTPVPVTISEDGVVREVDASDTVDDQKKDG